MEKPTRATFWTVIFLVVVALVIVFWGQVLWGQILKIWEILVGQPNVAIAFLTMVLVIVTVAYAVVTWRLLSHSRKAFMADMLIRMIEQHSESVEAALKRDGRWEEKSEKLRGAWSQGFLDGVRAIDKKLGKDLYRVFMTGWKAGKSKWEKEEKNEDLKELEKEIKGMRGKSNR